jgi:Type I restriction modification DNA specificity domain
VKSDSWSNRTIGELCKFSNGYGFRPPDWSKEGLPIIRIQNLNGSKEFNYFNGIPDESWLVEPGTILFAWAGVRGVSFGPTIWSGPRGVLNQHIYRIHPHIRKVKKDRWKGSKIKEREVLYAIQDVVKDDDLANKIFDLAKHQDEY